jgi:putative transposase
MPRKQFSSEQIITKLRDAEVLLSQGMTVIEAARQLDISEQTNYRWRKEYAGLDTNQARKLKALEKENLQLKKLVADLSLDNALLKEVLSKSDQPGLAASSGCTRAECAGCFGATSLPGNRSITINPKI